MKMMKPRIIIPAMRIHLSYLIKEVNVILEK